MLRAEQHARRRRRIERQLGELFAPWRDAAPRIQRAQPFELALRRGERGRGRRVEPGERGRIARAPLRQFEQQRGQIGGFHFRRIEARSPAMAAFLPQAIGDARPLTRGAARALCRGGLAGAMRDQMRRPRRAIEFGAARQAGIDHHRHAIQGERGFGDRACQHDPPPPVRIAPDRQPLLRRLDLAMERQHQRFAQARLDPLAHAIDLADAGQEGEDIALLRAPGTRNRIGHRIFDPAIGRAAQPFDPQRVCRAFAFDDRRIVAQQAGEARAVDRRRHHQHAQILAQHGARLQRQREAEIAVEMAFMRLVEQHGGNARQFGIVEQHVDEDRFGHDQHARLCRTLAVEPGEIADRLARLFAQDLRHPLRRGARGDPAGRGQDDGAAAPFLADQRRCDRGGLARPRRRDQHRAGRIAQGGEQIGQDGMDGQVSHGDGPPTGAVSKTL